MRVMLLSTDRLVFEEGSATRARMREYGGLFDELAVIVLSQREEREERLESARIAENVTLYPTRSRTKAGMLWDAFSIGSNILASRNGFTVSAQDPFFTGFIGYLLARRFRVPLQLQVHTDFLSPYFLRSLRSLVERILAELLLPRASCVRVVSERIRNGLLSRAMVAPSRLSVLPIFTREVSLPSQGRGGGPLRILMASRLEAEKDIPLALKAFRDLLRTAPGARLSIVGDGRERASLERLTEKLGLSHRVSFLGWQSGEDLFSSMQEADIFLSTSRFEGYNRTLIEAAFAGCAILSTDAGIAGEILTKEEAVIIPVGDRQALLYALERLASDAPYRLALGAKARAAALARCLTDKQSYLKQWKHALESCQ